MPLLAPVTTGLPRQIQIHVRSFPSAHDATVAQ
jgi:hypothetical protein